MEKSDELLHFVSFFLFHVEYVGTGADRSRRNIMLRLRSRAIQKRCSTMQVGSSSTALTLPFPLVAKI
jgi:hypothetical protein